MKIGIETESFHLHFQYGKMDIFSFIDKAVELGFEGVELNIITGWGLHPELGGVGANTKENLDKIRKKIEENNLFVEIDTNGTSREDLDKAIKVANHLGADTIRSYIKCDEFEESLYERTKKELKEVLPILEKYKIKLVIENHEFETSDELIQMIKEIDSDWVGLLFDFGNSMMAWEDPIEAAEKMAPYTYGTHFKDHIIIEDSTSEYGYVVAGIPLGEGSIDLDTAFKIMVEKSPLKRINMEICYPYCSEFKRKPGIGGVQRVGEGAFEVKEAPYDSNLIKPLEYYYPHKVVDEEFVEKMLADQLEGVKNSVKYLKALRNKYCK